MIPEACSHGLGVPSSDELGPNGVNEPPEDAAPLFSQGLGGATMSMQIMT